MMPAWLCYSMNSASVGDDGQGIRSFIEPRRHDLPDCARLCCRGNDGLRVASSQGKRRIRGIRPETLRRGRPSSPQPSSIQKIKNPQKLIRMHFQSVVQYDFIPRHGRHPPTIPPSFPQHTISVALVAERGNLVSPSGRGLHGHAEVISVGGVQPR